MKQTKVEVPLPPKPCEVPELDDYGLFRLPLPHSPAVQELLDELEKAPGPDPDDEFAHEHSSEEMEIFSRLCRTEDVHQGYIRLWDVSQRGFFETFKVYGVVRFKELERRMKPYHILFMRRISEEEIVEETFDGEYALEAEKKEEFPGQDLYVARYIREDGNMSSFFRVDPRLHKKAFSFPAGTEIPYGGKKNKGGCGQVSMRRLTSDEEAKFLKWAFYVDFNQGRYSPDGPDDIVARESIWDESEA